MNPTRSQPLTRRLGFARPLVFAALISFMYSIFRRYYRAMSEEPTLVDVKEKKPHLKLAWASIAELQAGLKQQEFTSEDLVNTYKARIEDVNPKIHAISVLNPHAVDIARLEDEKRNTGETARILDGIPILLKDVFLTDDQMPSTAGCSGLVDARPKSEATVIQKLRKAGAIISGKTVPSQWANYRSPGKAPNGWSAFGGQCSGIYCEDQDPGGSSSGSAVAVALGLAAAALGTETSGSIASPARSAGIVGLKPTTGLTSRHGVFCVSELQDSVGVLAKSVRDAAHVLTAIAGRDPMDPLSSGDPRDVGEDIRPEDNFDFRACCQDDGLKGVRVAIPRHCMNRDEFTMAQFNDALRIMETLGAVIVEDTKFPEWNLTVSKRNNWKISFRVDAQRNMERFLSGFEQNPHNLQTMSDIMKYTANTSEEEAIQWGMTEWTADEEMAAKYGPDTDEYKESAAFRLHMSGQIKELLDKYNCDVIAAPWWTDTTAPIAGCPQVSVPLPAYPEDASVRRLAKGLITTGPNIPTGIIFVGRRWEDAKVIAAAHAFEVTTNHRSSFKPVIETKIELPQNY